MISKNLYLSAGMEAGYARRETKSKQYTNKLFLQTITNGAGLTERFCPQCNMHNHRIKKTKLLLLCYRSGCS